MRLFTALWLLLRLDPGQAVETALSRKVSEPLWLESTFAQALDEIQHACGSAMTQSASTPAAAAFRSIAERLLRPSARNAIEVQFLDCGRQFFALTLGAVILVNTAWLARASEDDLWLVAAHEMAHRPSDFSRRVVIGLHVPGLDAAAQERLAMEMEIQADAGAVRLLRSAGRDPASLRRFLEKENRAAPSAQLRRRLEALRP
jgi:predicted Zn-dependent protease